MYTFEGVNDKRLNIGAFYETDNGRRSIVPSGGDGAFNLVVFKLIDPSPVTLRIGGENEVIDINL